MWIVFLAVVALASVAGSPCCSENKENIEPPQIAQKPANNELNLTLIVNGIKVNAEEIIKLIGNIKTNEINWKYIDPIIGNDLSSIFMLLKYLKCFSIDQWVTVARKTQKTFIQIKIVTRTH